jgi:hypothetical protein
LNRGHGYFIQWEDNIPENVILGLYKADALVQVISTNAAALGHGALLWQVPANLEPGTDYSIRITSATNSALSAVSQSTFNIDAPAIDPGSLTSTPDGRISFTLTAFGFPQVTISASTNLISWQDIAVVPLTNGVASFTDTDILAQNQRFYRIRLP